KEPEKKSEEALADNARDAVRRAEWASAAERVARAEAALPMVQSYEASLPRGSVEQRNAKLDRVRALTLADHLDEAAALFETLGPAEELPLYGVMNGADLYARRHEPERAQVLLDLAAKRQPDSRELLVARYYNQLDLEQYDHAEQTLTKLRETTTDERSRRDVEIMSAMFAAYQNDLEQAQQQLEHMLRDEPHNTDIQLRLAQIYRWRGWPRRALGEYRSAADIADDPTSARVGEIAALDDLHAFTQSHVRLQQLTASAPTHPEVIQSNQDRRLRERWDYSAQILTGHSSGGPVTTGGDLAFEQKLYSPPLGDQYRAFVHQRYDWADFPEGTGSANRLGVGGDFRSPALDGSAELTDRVPGGQLGLTVSGEWKFGDRFSAFGEAQTDSTQVPLRAVHAGIDGHSETLGVLYRADESHSARASFSRAHFSDGNQRNALIAQYQQTIFQDARSKITGVVQGYYSDNSAGNNVPYFNPASESLIGIAGIYEGVLWRGGERRWAHRLQLGISDYEQKYFGSGGIWDAEYEQRWQLSDSFSFNYGLLYRSRIYDGGREGYIAVLGGINWRF
ncbi:MAG TPA: hypothetical protein VFM32_07425, partial [Spongiibacteraceae bacterium]|nr:hypothetical protein [Spongiibacteraceae bacterium]